MLETSKHSIRAGRLSRLSDSRSSSRASTRRRRCCSRRDRARARAARSPPPAGRARASPPLGARTSTRAPRRSPRNAASASVSLDVRRDDHLRRHGRRAAVVLDAERLEDRRPVLAGDVLEVEGEAVDELAVPQREQLDGGAVVLDGEADHVDRPHRPLVRRLPLREALDRPQPVAIARRLLESLLGRRLPHPSFERTQDRLRFSGEELDHPLDDRAVVVLGDRPDAGRGAPLDVVVEARDPGVAPGLRPLARPELEHTVQDVERLAYLFRVGVRPEVDGVAPVPLAREHDARKGVGDRHGDVRKRLVVPQPHVERRPVALHEVLLEVERLRLALRHDHLEPVDPPDQLLDPRARVAAAVPVAADAGPERLRLADVEDLVAVVAEEVHPGPRR